LRSWAARDGEEPENVKERIEAAEKRAANAEAGARKTQVRNAVLEYLGEQYPEYQTSAKYIVAQIALGDEAVDDDTRLYDDGLLSLSVKRECKQFVRDNPRAPRGNAGAGSPGAAGASDAGTGGAASPSRAFGQLPGSGKGLSAEQVTALDQEFGGVLSRIAGK
jgi:hypothetical protein